MDYVPLLRAEGPRYLALTAAIIDDIRAGRLPAGARLPGSRSLAGRLHIHRNTIVRAYGELTAQGWTTAEVGSGTVVVPLAPGLEQSRQASPTLGFHLPAPNFRPIERDQTATWAFLGGQPDLRLLPADLLSRAYRRALKLRGRQLANYGDPQGWEGLRRQLAAWLGTQRALSIGPEQLIITRGAQQALYLIAHTVFRPGDRVAVESHGYAPAWEALRTAGVELVPIPVDTDGMRVDLLRDQPNLKGVYVTPHHQFPTGAMLSASRRATLLHLARDRQMAVIEDDYAHEFHWQGHPVAPLAARDPHGVVIYVGTLSKAFAPGIRLGWVAAPTALITRLTALRRLVDRQGDQIVEAAVMALMAEGDLDRHIRRMHRCYRDRREALLAGLGESLPDLEVFVPPGGLAVWARAPGIDVEAWAAAAKRRDAFIATAQEYRLDREIEHSVRLGFANLDPDEIRVGLSHLAAALAEIRKPAIRDEEKTGVRKRFTTHHAFQQELHALEQLHPERILTSDPATREIRQIWLSGRPDSLEPEAHRAAGAWLRRLHDRPCETTDIPLSQALQIREDALRASAAEHMDPQDIDQALEGFDPRKLERARSLCHRDFRPGNWLWDGTTLHVLNFEHTRPDHPMLDLVRLASEVWPNNPELQRAFQEGYGPFDHHAVSMLRKLYDLQNRLSISSG